MAWYTPFTDILTDIGGWMKLNPEATQLLGSAAAGAASYYMKEKEMKQQRQRWDQEDKRYENVASNGVGYDSHVKNISGGTGLLATYKPLQ